MSTFTAFFDTNVLVPGAVRDLLIQLATTGAFRAKWSHSVLAELRRTLIARRGMDAARCERLIELMELHAADPLVEGFESTIDGIALPDPDDRHVVAAAIHANAGVIITYNLKHFPDEALAPHGLEAQHPDEFVADLLDLHPAAVIGSVHAILKRLKAPPKTPNELLAVYTRHELVRTAVELGEHLGISDV